MRLNINEYIHEMLKSGGETSLRAEMVCKDLPEKVNA